MTMRFKTGEYSEGDPWAYIEDYETSVSYIVPCGHAVMLEPITTVAFDGREIVRPRCRVPRVVQCSNEAGCNVTVLCLDCVLEKVPGMKA